jgi:uncharacterized protein YnzC (UPF0291/DUF896 family)
MRPQSRTTLLLILLFLHAGVVLYAQSDTSTQPPQYPITEDQVRTIFKVAHYESYNLPLLELKLEQQRKQLPPWYPQGVWDEIVRAIENVDVPKLALPVYQKYLSTEDASWLIRFTSLPQGQEIIKKAMSEEAALQTQGVDPLKAYDKTMQHLANEEGAEVARIANEMAASEEQELLTHGERFRQMQPLFAQMRQEYFELIKAKHVEIAKAVAAEHASELREAKRRYEAANPADAH